MPLTILYIATSIDGFIARPDGNLDWLTSTPMPELGDYGYAALLESTDTIIMGRKTYDELIGFGGEWPYIGFNTYVVSNDPAFKIQSPDTFVINGNLKELISGVKAQNGKNIWLVGGGQLIAAFLNEKLLDKMIITFIPKTLGKGIPLFTGSAFESDWKLTETQAFNTGVVNLTYTKI
jgi:dihydrofolate reductase